MCHIQRIFRSFYCRFIDLSLNITSTTTLHTIAVIIYIMYLRSTYPYGMQILVSIEYSYTREYECSKRVLIYKYSYECEYRFGRTHEYILVPQLVLLRCVCSSSLMKCTFEMQSFFEGFASVLFAFVCAEEMESVRGEEDVS